MVTADKLLRMRITLVISSLRVGGAERVMASMANYWVEHGHQVTLVTLNSCAADWYPLYPQVTRVALDLASDSSTLWQALRANVRRIVRLRRALRASRPNAIVSFMDATNVLTLIAGTGLHVPVIISERTDPRHHRIGRVWQGLRQALYRKADAVVVQTNAVSTWAKRLARPDAVRVIPNPVAVEAPHLPPRSTPSSRTRTVVAMGSLSKPKGFDLLLQAFAQCVYTRSGWYLEIMGDGAERAKLEALAGTLGITDQVHFHGRVFNPTTILTCADLFVLSSRYEGFPNALLEAMACGIAVVATDCPSGPRDIIRDGIDGLLVPAENMDALSHAMGALMDNPEHRVNLGRRAREISDRFSVHTIMAMWESLVQELHKGNKGISLTEQRLDAINNQRG